MGPRTRYAGDTPDYHVEIGLSIWIGYSLKTGLGCDQQRVAKKVGHAHTSYHRYFAGDKRRRLAGVVSGSDDLRDRYCRSALGRPLQPTNRQHSSSVLVLLPGAADEAIRYLDVKIAD